MSFVVRRALIVLVVISAIAPAQVARAGPCWEPPVRAPVTDPFREPGVLVVSRQSRHRVRHDVRVSAVRAVATGRVTFAGSVAGTVYVVVRHRRRPSGHVRRTSFRRVVRRR